MHEIYTCKLRSKWARLTLLFKMLLGKHLRFQVGLPALKSKITQRTEKLRGGHHSEDKHIRKHWDEDSVIQMLKSENPAFTCTL